MPNTEIRKFDGLYLQANSFEVPDGAMEIAENVVIQSDHIISKSKGYYEWWKPGGGDTVHNIKAIYTYQEHIIGAFEDGIAHFQDADVLSNPYNKIGIINVLDGAATSFGPSTFFATANQNLYMTGLQGIFRIEAFYLNVKKVGVPPGVSISLEMEYSQVGVLEAGDAGTQTGYRAVFGRRDFNGNLLLSSPSDIAYAGIPAPLTMLSYTIVSGTVTVTTNSNLFDDREGQYIIVSSGTNSALNGSHIIDTVTPGTDLTFSTGEANSTGTLTISVSGTASITADIPSEIDDPGEEWFVQFYRTSASLSVDSIPTSDFRLSTEQTITFEDIVLGFVRYTDIVDKSLLGNELYTNPNSQEGELQANIRPPQAKVIAPYKNYMLYGNVVTIQRLYLDMVNSYASLLGNDITFKAGLQSETYTTGGSIHQEPSEVTGTGTGVITVTDPLNDPSSGDEFEIYDITGTLSPGRYTVLSSIPGVSYTFSASGQTMTNGTVEFLKLADGRIIYDIITHAGYTAPQEIDFVSRQLVRAVNRNSIFMYANYISNFIQFPGKMLFSTKGISDPIYVKLEEIRDPQPFIQPIPDTFLTGKQIYSENDVLKNAVYFSKVGEPEAVPVLNREFAGDASAKILSMIPLRDAVIIVKEDGVFKLAGDTLADFQIIPLDSTVEFSGDASRISGNINNQVIALSNQGIVNITETSVQVASRRIDDGIQPLSGKDLTTTFLGGNEADRLFYINTSGINDGDADVCWVYNVLNQTWTTSTEVFSYLTTGPDDSTFGIIFDSDANANVIHRQRRTQTFVDYTGKYCYGDITVSVDKLTATFVITGGNAISPGVGDVILYNNVFSRIISSTAGGGSFALTFSGPTNIPTSGTTEVFVYKAYRSMVRMAPFHAGQVSLSKHFSQMQIHLRQPAISDLKITFGGAYFGSSELTNWSLANISNTGASGWGYSPWGFFPWGLADGIKISTGTQSASIIRTYVPRFAARNTWIACQFQHTIAGQPMQIQCIAYDVRGYASRVSK